MKNTLQYEEYLILVKEINSFRHAIHLFESDTISEGALDDLKHKITLFEQENPDKMSKNSPNYTIASSVSDEFVKFRHKTRMISLGDVFDKEELDDWQQRFIDFAAKQQIHIEQPLTYVCEPKIDGLAISVHYENGELKRGVTRGDSFVGEDVTHNIMHVTSIPKSIPDTRYQEIRGELFFTKEAFEQLNKSILEGKKIGKMGKTGRDAQFANPRNAASGTIRQLDSSIVKERNLSFIAYNVIIYETPSN